jgi:hypothetical protein
MVITELDKSRLSVVQRGLLARALRAHDRCPSDQACGDPYPGCLELKAAMRSESDRHVRAVRRAAAGRAIARLVARTHGMLHTREMAAFTPWTRSSKSASSRSQTSN